MGGCWVPYPSDIQVPSAKQFTTQQFWTALNSCILTSDSVSQRRIQTASVRVQHSYCLCCYLYNVINRAVCFFQEITKNLGLFMEGVVIHRVCEQAIPLCLVSPETTRLVQSGDPFLRVLLCNHFA